MFSPSLVRLSLLALIGQLVLADDPAGKTFKCSLYTGANTTHAKCNERPDVVCKQGCTGYVTAEGCQPNADPTAPPAGPPSTQKCEIGFGRNTAAARVVMAQLPAKRIVTVVLQPNSPG
ncbi:hypothetical protein PTTG_25643 [Puccinia triticina 1-1 BBBD Race 1]|uniref:Uncharacterized protein n=2 Tax=Puccinia triticina TaxID=208348 RepID=A0A180H1Y8_PUCT1|nr:uncharacterized protein PtA15_9A414 [Puccinia triticina]OAV98383.1 hypothetical protein PTTG_25643 [Puccinia triticina 1-1 BBBD Race 1]WAQ88287.1 hypothetical protein PtA15_9A414 [Puccinia triticina]WAR60460.1 hypothetical protein PtB15_9B399 [Puccinia triticina]